MTSKEIAMFRQLLMIFCSAFSLSAYSAPLSWQDCVQMVKTNNEELAIEIARLEASQLREGTARGGFLPNISGNLSYSKSGSYAPTESESESYGAGLNLSQNLFNGLADYQNYRLSKTNTEITLQNLQAVKARLSKELKMTFENLRHAERSIQLQEAVFKRRQENVRLVELRFKNGRENKGSLLKAKADLSSTRVEVLESKLSLRSSRAALGKVLGIENYEGLSVQGEVPLSPLPLEDISLSTLVNNTPSMLSAKASEEAAQIQLHLKKSSFIPKLDMSAGLNQNADDFFPERNRNWSLGVTLSIPLFNGGRDYYETRAQGKVLLAAIHQRVNTQQSTLLALENAHRDYLISNEKVKVKKELVEAESVRAEIGRMKYNNGLLNFEEWNNIENSLINEQKGQLDQLKDLVFKEAAWQDSQGKDIFK